MVLALMKRVPSILEADGVKVDTTYFDKAYDKARAEGVREGLERAAREVEEARESDPATVA